MKYTFLVIVCILIGGLSSVQAQQFTYQPISPFFGGTNAFAYQQVLSSANAQNGLQDPAAVARDQRTELERFADNVNAQVLSQLSRSLTSAQVEGLDFNEPGSFTAGEFAIEIFEGVEGLVINILDTTTGEESQIIVPN